MVSETDAKIFRFDINALIGLTILSLPVSIKIFLPLTNIEIIYPAELFIGFLGALFFYKFLFRKEKFAFANKAFLKHPITLLVFLYLAVNILSAVFSTMPLVSLKALMVKLCYILVFYFMVQPLLNSSSGIIEMLKLYGFSLAFVVLYTYTNRFVPDLKWRHAFYSNPFYSDHTIYAAALAFLLPAFLAFSLFAKTLEIRAGRIPALIVAVLLSLGLYYSFSRAGWISIAFSGLLFLLIMAGMRFYMLIAISICLITLALFNTDSLINYFNRNKIESTVWNAGAYEKALSVTNITTDISNAERLNRWSCASRMFLDKPLLGFGPGTFQFQYLPYQMKDEITPISIIDSLQPGTTTYSWSPSQGINAPQRTSVLKSSGGTAHSEYLLALSETGIVSALSFLGLLIASLYIALRTFSKSHCKKIKIIALFLLLGLISYFVHALFNNFLDDCKLAFLFWVSVSALATIDIINGQENLNKKNDFLNIAGPSTADIAYENSKRK